MSPLYQNTTGQVPKSVKPGTGFNIAFIEFGEQGSYLDTSQVEAAVKLVRATRKPLVISYVHGWHNNAGSGDVNRFSTFLAQIAATPLIRDKGFQVIGVYLGWRGEITDVPVVRQLSFYSRKAAAERLASNFDCFDAISSIAEAARSHPRSEQYTILLGHSFGGLVVERAVAHAIDAEMHGRSHRYNSLPADLTLVLNPASDSILSRQMIAALYQEKTENSTAFRFYYFHGGRGHGKVLPVRDIDRCCDQGIQSSRRPRCRNETERARLLYFNTGAQPISC